MENTTRRKFICGLAAAGVSILYLTTEESLATGGLIIKYGTNDPSLVLVRNETMCIACGGCVQICSEGAITLDEKLPVIDVNKCIFDDCSACAEICPTGALKVNTL